jgi:putative hydrolase of the HAD superfamily
VSDLAPPVPLRAVLLDALGTLVALEPPAPRLRGALLARGVAVSEEDAARAMAAEIRLYLAEHGAAGTREALEELRDRAAAVVESELRTGLPAADVRGALLEAIAFAPHPEVPGVLRALRGRGLRLVACSNWDVSLHEALAATGIDALLDGAVASAELGVAKPDPRAFAAALELAGCAASEALHVGDDLATDVAVAVDEHRGQARAA